jgi:Tol biopolymer transport system component
LRPSFVTPRDTMVRLYAALAAIARLMPALVVGVTAPSCERGVHPPCAVRLPIAPPAGTEFVANQIPAVSPDGSRVAFTARADDRMPRLWVQSLRRSTVREVPGTDGARFPFWSPDGERLGFFADGQLKRTDLLGEVSVLAEAADALGGSWNGRDAIIFSAGPTHAIWTIPSGGGAIRQVSRPGGSAGAVHAWPSFVDDEHFVYSSVDSENTERILLGSLRSNEQNTLLEGTNSPPVVTRQALFFAGRDLLFSTAFNVNVLDIDHAPNLVAQGVARGPFGLASFGAAANNSVMVYGRAGRTIVWLDRDGQESTAVPEPGAYEYLSLSPAGDEILVAVGGTWLGTGPWIYEIYNVHADRWRRVVAGIASLARPLWSADGSEVIFTAIAGSGAQVRAVRSDGSGATRRLFDESGRAYAAAVSPTGLIAMVEPGPRTTRLRVVSWSSGRSLDASTVWRQEVPRRAYAPAFSPDGSRLAYVSEQSGTAEVYVSELAHGAVPVRVSPDGGSFPVWSGDGRWLSYINGLGRRMAITTEGPASEWGQRERAVFSSETPVGRYDLHEFQPSPYGARFLTVKSPDPARLPALIGVVSCGAWQSMDFR